MKRSVQLLFVFGLMISIPLNAQKFVGGVMAGMNLTQVDGDEVFGFYKGGLNLGAEAILPFGKKNQWSVSLGIQFSQKGSHQGVQNTDTMMNGSYTLRMNYVEVPLLLSYTDKRVIKGGVGVSYGQLVGVKEWESSKRTATTLAGPYAKEDICLLGDVQFRMYKRFWLDLRYSYSLLEIRTRHYDPYPGFITPWERKQYNNVITVRVVYLINETVPEKRQKKK
jgi:hypothetical protein